MAIQNRRGDYKDFDPQKMLPGEWATVLSGDPNASDGRAVYKCFEPGVVKRMATYEDMKENIEQSAGEIIDEAIEEALKETGGGSGGGSGATEEQIQQIETNKQNIASLQQTVDGIKVPAKTSELDNDSGFITKTIGDLANYYLKSETYTRDEVKALISAIPKFAIQPVDSLPTADISITTVYLLKSGEETDNLYTEYIYVNGSWEYLGKQTVDLSGYAKKATTLAGYGITDGATSEQLNEVSQDVENNKISVSYDETNKIVRFFRGG